MRFERPRLVFRAAAALATAHRRLRTLGLEAAVAAVEGRAAERPVFRKICRAVDVVGTVTRSTCLPRALATWALCCHFGIDARLCVGVAQSVADRESAGRPGLGDFAHAWVESGRAWSGGIAPQRFVVVYQRDTRG